MNDTELINQLTNERANLLEEISRLTKKVEEYNEDRIDLMQEIGKLRTQIVDLINEVAIQKIRLFQLEEEDDLINGIDREEEQQSKES